MIEISSKTSVLSPADRGSVLDLVAAAEVADGVAPLSEQTLLSLDDRSAVVRHLLARSSIGSSAFGALAAYAHLDATGTAELVVAPSVRRGGVGRELARALQKAAAGSPLQVWAHGDHPGGAALAVELGYIRARVLLQLRRSLRGPLPEPRFPAGVSVRTFDTGADESAWLEVNNAAFAHHPEQGRWTLHDVDQREQQDWFDAKGLFLAERDGQIVGFHWTKVHRGETPAIGEVYIVGVRPQDAGHGLGPALTLVGLHHLRSLGLEQVLLYVDEDNTPAMRTYEGLGFHRFATDVLYTGG